MDTSTSPAAAALALTDRCDRCGSRAYVRATLPSARDLLFCGHHGNEHGPALLAAGAVLLDEAAALTAPRESSAAA